MIDMTVKEQIKRMHDNENTAGLTKVQALIEYECQQLGQFLIEKNRKYGNSAIDPKRVFSTANPIEQINVRIDDKLSRIANQQSDDDEDAELDLLGYLILKRVAMKVQG